MPAFPSPSLITSLTPRGYLTGTTSHFRRYQDMFLERHGRELSGRVIEVGGEKKYNHARFFPAAKEFVCSNVGRECDVFLDVTDLPFADDSQDAYVCVSVLSHVFEIRKAFEEMRRTLKPGGTLLLAQPFAFPVCDVADYWRPSRTAYDELLKGFEVKTFVHLGGRYSSIVDALQRPKGNLARRHLPAKLLGLFLTIAARPLERIDDFPLGFGIVATKS